MQKFYNLFRLNSSLLWNLKFNLLFTFFFVFGLLASGLQAVPLSFPDDGIEKIFVRSESQDSLSLKWIQRKGTTNTSWFSVAWGGPKGEEVFVAVGENGIKTSPDGINWTPRLAPNNNTWISVTWGGPVGQELFVAVAVSGTGDRVMTSPDGITWTPRSAATDLGWVSVTWGGPVGNELFVAVAVNGTGQRVMTSSDGITWTSRAAVDDISWRAVTWGGPAGNGLFVAGGANGKVMTSPDGITWTSQTTSFTGLINAVTWGGPSGQELFVAVGGGGVYTSPDGINWNWTLQQLNISFSAVTWGGPIGEGLFVATSSSANSNRVITSPDGINWTIQFNDTSINKDWRSVTWGGPVGQELFVAVASKIIGAVDNNDQQVMTASRSTLTVMINSVVVLTNSSVKVGSILGDFEVIERGLIYSDTLISNNPILETNGIVTIVDGSTAAANFDLTLSNLSPNKIYVVKAYIKTTNGKVFYSAADYFSTNTAPAFDHSLSDGVLKIDIPENSTTVLDLLVTDPDQGQTLVFTLQGTDAALFEVDQATRQLSFKAAPDFEDPIDQNKDNVYELAVIATDNAPLPKSSTLMIQARVSNVSEIPVIQNQAITDIGSRGAKLNARIVHNGGGGTVTASGFVLSATSANSTPQLGGAGVSAVSAGASQADFSNLVSGLEAGISYSYRAYATNGTGTAYSEVATFITLSTVTAPPVFGYAPALLKEIDKPISVIQPGILGSEIPEDQTYASVSTFSTNVSGPRGMVMDAFGNLYVAERGGRRISRFAPNGTKTVIRQFDSFEPVDITIDSNTGDLYSTIAGHRILSIPNTNKSNYPAQQPTHVWTNDATNVFAGASTSGTTDNVAGTSARFNTPAGIAMSPDNTYLLVAEYGSHRIRKIDLATKLVTTFAGSATSGTADGQLTSTARFNNPEGVHFANDGSIYVTEWNAANHRVRKISGDQVSTLAGATLGFVDGLGTIARFERPRGITSDPVGNLYVVEGNNNVVRRITPSGEVGVLAGSLLGGYDNTKGTTDGVAFAARFDAPQGVYFAPDGFLYVSDNVGNRIRKISLSGWELLTPLPVGLSFDGNTAEISGTPTTFTFEPHYFSAFDSNTLDKDSKGGTPVLTGAAQVRSGFLQLTPFTNAQNGGLHIPGKGIKEGILRVDFRIFTTKTSSAGNGISYSFAKDINSTTAGTPEVGIGSGISLAFNTSLGGVRLYYGASKANSSTVGTGGLIAINANNTWRGKSAQVSLEVSYEGKVNVWIDGTLVFNDVQLPEAYLKEDFTSWNHAFRAGTGTSNDLHAIDNLSVAQGYGKGSYPVRASNRLGTHSSSLELSVVTLPVVNTLAISDISSNSAKVSFRTLFNGGDQLQKQGVIWGASPDVTVDNALGKTEEILTQEEILAQLTALSELTQYYVRAYAKNAFGVGYGSELSFQTPITPPLFAYASDRIILKKDQSAALAVTSSGGAVPNVFPYEVSTFAGSTAGFSDGQATDAQFDGPIGITVDAAGIVYVSDWNNQRIRKITPDGIVSTFAGSSFGFTDGQGTAARFFKPHGIVEDAAGNLYLADDFNHAIRKITPDGMVSTLAGGSFGNRDGQGIFASFNNPKDVAVDDAGNVYVADGTNYRIRKISPSGLVTTLAGSTKGSTDGQGTAAQFDYPAGIALDAVGNVYVTEYNNHRIRKITPDGMVTTLAGSSFGSLDGQGTAAQFKNPTGITVDADGNLYVTDYNSHRIRKITPNGMVTTLAGSIRGKGSLDGQGTSAQFNNPNGITLDGAGNLYVADQNNHRIRKITTTGWSISPALPAGLEFNPDGSITGTPTANSPTQTYTVTGANASGSYSYSFELGVQELGLANLTVSNGSLNVPFKPEQTVYSVSVDATVSSISFTATELFAGSTIQWKQGAGSFTSITSGTASPEISIQGGTNTITLEVSEDGNSKTYILIVTKPVSPPAIGYVQSLTLPLGEAMTPQLPQNSGGTVPSGYANIVSTLAGSGFNDSAGFKDGPGSTAKFNSPRGVAVDVLGNVYVADRSNHRIRKITPDGQVSTLAGSGLAGSADGLGVSAQFNFPNEVAVDYSGNVYVTDFNSHRIRKITPDGLVSTLAGGQFGFADGTGSSAQFRNPWGIAVDASENVYVTDYRNERIRKISPTGVVSTLAGSGDFGYVDGLGKSAQFKNPTGIVVDPSGNVYVAEENSHRIRKITPDGQVSTLAGSGDKEFEDGPGSSAKFDSPYGVSLDISGNVYVADWGNHKIRKIAPDGLVSTLAGTSRGFEEGELLVARFNHPAGVSLDASGNVYVADQVLSRIRKISLSGWSVSPSLPAGLVLNQDGSISGTPKVLSPSKHYLVTGRNAAGESSYTIHIEVTAGPTDGLRNLEISEGNLSPAFSSTILAYEGQLPSTAETFTFTPTAVNANAAITLNGIALVNATATQAYPLNFGPNTFKFIVKETNNTEKTYTVVVTRALGSQQNEILWAGSSSKKWTSGSNWTGNTAPDFGEDIKFSPTAVNDLEVDDDLTAGTIDFNGSDKKVVLVNNDLSVSGFASRTAPNYVEIIGSGRLKASIGSNLKFLFPVGMTTYSPVAITNKTGAAAVFSVGLSGEVYEQGTSGNAIPNARIKRTWDIGNASSSVSGSGIDLEFTWTAGDDSGVKNPALYHYENGGWVKLDDAKTTVDIANRVLIYKGYTGSLSPFAIYDELPSETQLTISAPTLTKTKLYDGTNTAQVTVGTLSGVADDDEVTVTATAEYDNANAGTGKTIRVVYTLDGADASKYLKPVDGVYADGEITKIQLTATVPTVTTSKVYDGTVKATVQAGTLQGVLTDEIVNLFASAAYETATAGSSKKITVTYRIDGSDAVNYLAPADEEVSTGEITKAALTVKVKDDAKFVGQIDAVGFNGIDILGFVGGEDESVLSGTLAISRSNSSVNSAGDYPGVLVGSGYTSDNYALNYIAGDFSILPAEVLLVKLATVTTIYGNDPEYTVLSAGYFSAAEDQLVDLTEQTFVSGNSVQAFDGFEQIRFDLDMINPLLSTSGNLQAGSYIVRFVDEELSSNVNSLKVIGKVEVAPLALEATVSTGQFKEYDGTPAMIGVNVDAFGLIAGDEVTVLTGAGMFGGSNAGNQEYTLSGLTLSGTDAVNYTLDAELKGQGQISAKALTVSGTSVTKVKAYDGTATAQVSRGTVSGVINTDKVSLSVSASYADKFAGKNKPITVSYSLEGNAAGNYIAPASESILDGEITRKALTITDPSVVLRKAYDGTRAASVEAGSLLGLIPGDNVTVTASAQFDNASVGTGKTITVSYSLAGSDTLNYQTTLQEFVTDQGEIYATGPIQLLVTEPSLELIKGYDGTTAVSQPVTGTLIGLAAGAAVQVEATAVYENSQAGKGKKITVTYTLSGTDAGDYLAPPVYTVFTGEITPVQLTVSGTAVEKTKPYDGGTMAEVTAAGTLSGIVNGDEGRVELKAAATFEDKHVGSSKKISVAFELEGDQAGNYLAPTDLVLDGGEITKAPLIIRADDKLIDCGAGIPIFTWTYVGLLGDDRSIETEPSISSQAVQGSVPGSYAITLSGGESRNYAITLESGSLLIRELAEEVIEVTACETYTWELNDETYTESGIYEVNEGCQTYILELTINKPEVLEVTVCGSYTWNGEVYTDSGTYDFTPEGASCVTERLILTFDNNIILELSKEEPESTENIVGEEVGVAMVLKDACGSLLEDYELEDFYIDFGADTTAKIRNFRFEDDLYKFDVYSERSGLLTVKVGIDEVVESDLILEFVSTGVIDIENSILNAKDQAKLVADGKVALPVTIQALDKFGNVVPGVTITLVQPASGRTIIRVNQVSTTSRVDMLTAFDSVSGVTDAEGNVGFTISSTVAQKVRYIVYAEIDGELVELGSFELEFLADKIDVASSTVEADPAIQVIEERSVLKVSLQDENGNPNIGLLEEDFEIDLGRAKAELVADSFQELLVENEDGIEVPTGVYTWEILGTEPEKVTVSVKVKQIEYGDEVDNGDDDIDENENEFEAADVEDEEEWLDLGAVDIEFILPCLIEDITYSGVYFASTSGTRSNEASVLLSASILAKAGEDVEGVKVRFVDLETGNTLTDWLSVQAVPSQPGLGTVSRNVTMSIGSLDSRQFLIGIEVENCDFDANQSQVLVTVSRPLDDFVTGGGYLLENGSAGVYEADEGSRINFGFNVKFNRQRSNMQGSTNIIFRKDGRIYRIRANNFTSLSAANATSSSPAQATYTARANLFDVTDPNMEVSVASQRDLVVVMTDRNTAGANEKSIDDISFTLWDNGNLLFSSQWSMGKTQQQRVDRGNVQVNQPKSNAGRTANTLELTSDAVNNTSTEGQSVTFTAKIIEDDSATPTGTITFLSGNMVLGFAPVSNNMVVFRTSMLEVGMHDIWAYYSGDSRFASSSTEEGPLNHTVMSRLGDSDQDPPVDEEPVSDEPVKEDPVSEPPVTGPKKGKGKSGTKTLDIEEESYDLSELSNLEESVSGMWNMAELKLSAYPNPSKGQFELSLIGFEDGRVSVMVLNAAGASIKNIEHEYGKGRMRVAVDITDHAPGIYFCYVRQGRLVQMIRLIKNQ